MRQPLRMSDGESHIVEGYKFEGFSCICSPFLTSKSRQKSHVIKKLTYFLKINIKSHSKEIDNNFKSLLVLTVRFCARSLIFLFKQSLNTFKTI